MRLPFHLIKEAFESGTKELKNEFLSVKEDMILFSL